MNLKSKYSQNYLSFIANWAKSPRLMGAVSPSSRYLSRAMVAQIDLSKNGDIVEIGAGTGAVTKELIKIIPANKKNIVIEFNNKFFNILCHKFPNINIINDDAQNLTNILEQNQVNEVNAIVSSLPLLSLPIKVRNKAVAEMVQAIGDNGRIIQFTYGLKSPIPKELMELHNLAGECRKSIIINLPPAKVWVYQKS